MSDNVTLPGDTEVVATDDVAGVHFQRVKLDLGGDGASTPVVGTVPVSDGGGSITVDGTVEVSGTVAVSQSSQPLPTGAATETTLATIAGAIRSEDSAHASGDTGVMVLAVRADAETSLAIPDGDYSPLQVNAVGRLKVSTQPGLYDLVTGAITANGQTVFCQVDRSSNVMLHMVATALVGHNCTFEGSLNSTNGTDGNWFTIQAVRTNANTIETATGVLAATPAYAWEASVNGLSYMRVRATAHTSGTATWSIQRGSYATEPIPAAQISGTQPVSGTVALGAATTRVGFMAHAGIWYDDSSTALASGATFTGTSRDATVTATATAIANAGAYHYEVRAVAETDVAGTLWLEVSRDNANWRRIRSVATAAVTGGGQAAEIIYRPAARYWRIGYTNGATVQARFTLNTVAVA